MARTTAQVLGCDSLLDKWVAAVVTCLAGKGLGLSFGIGKVFTADIGLMTFQAVCSECALMELIMSGPRGTVAGGTIGIISSYGVDNF